MKQEQQRHYTTNEAAYQVVMPLDLGIKIPQDDSVRVLMRIAERIDWRKLSGAYERENSSWEATPKQMVLLIVLGFMNRLYRFWITYIRSIRSSGYGLFPCSPLALHLHCA